MKFNIANVQPGQRVTVKYSAPVKWARTTGNPFVDMEVTREMTVSFTAAGQATYSNMATKHGHEKSGKQPWFDWTPTIGPCVVSHRTNGTPYLAGINHDTCVHRFLVGGQPVSEAEEAHMCKFLRESEERPRGLDFRVWTVDKLQNAILV